MDDGREIPIPTGAMLGELLVSVAISKREA
jgi:hypothetical protein